MENTALQKIVENPYLAMDQLDDQQIVERIIGQMSGISEKLIYSFTQDGKEISGLSVKGIDECKRLLAQRGEYIRETEIRWEKDPIEEGVIIFIAKASRVVIRGEKELCLDNAIGTKRQSCTYRTKKGDIKTDPFWFEKGSQKALRNAVQGLIPHAVQNELLQRLQGRPKQKWGDAECLTLSQIEPAPAPAQAPWNWDDLATWEWRTIPQSWLQSSLVGQAITFVEGATDHSINFSAATGQQTLRQYMAYAWTEPTQKKAHDMLAAKYPSKPAPEPEITPEPAPSPAPAEPKQARKARAKKEDAQNGPTLPDITTGPNWVNTRVGWSKTGNLSWRDLAEDKDLPQEVEIFQDGQKKMTTSGRAYLEGLARWKKNQRVSEVAQFALTMCQSIHERAEAQRQEDSAAGSTPPWDADPAKNSPENHAYARPYAGQNG